MPVIGVLALLAHLPAGVVAPTDATDPQPVRSRVIAVAAGHGHSYRVRISWPAGRPPRAGWPALYVLDGERNFAPTVAALRRSPAGERGMVVAIESGSTDRRAHDYTPAVPGYAIPAGRPAFGRAVGGAAEFRRFLVGTLVPEIARRWRTDPRRRTLAGHSFGGVFAIDMLADGGRTFNGFAAVSPSLWYGDGHPVRAAARATGTARILIAAETDGADGGAQMQRAMVADMVKHGIDARFLPLPGARHGTSYAAALDPVIAFAFESATHPAPPN